MEKNYKILLAYDGTRYQGWESHKAGDMTIQGKVVNVIEHLAGVPVEVIGCGRTDAGVHAKGMVANVKLEVDMAPQELKSYLNHYLPEDIAVLDVSVATERFHSRYNAVGKTYCYTCYIGDTKPVFDRKYVYALDEKPDVEKMRKAAELLVGTHDFASFCANKKKKKSTVRTVDKIEITVEGGYLKFTVHGDGFLHHMVRILVGTLLEVGWGKRDAGSMPALIASCERAQAGATAPAQGLCMISVDY